MQLNNTNLESFLQKAEQDPKLMEVLKGIVYYCQSASELGISLDEVAAAGTVGWTIGQDPRLMEMLQHMINLGNLGLDPVEH